MKIGSWYYQLITALASDAKYTPGPMATSYTKLPRNCPKATKPQDSQITITAKA
jgi:hypothetical protein